LSAAVQAWLVVCDDDPLAHLALVGEASQQTFSLALVQDLQLFVVDAILLADILPQNIAEEY
jgi:hypothetical protein